jgi:predicted transcriptional regulator
MKENILYKLQMSLIDIQTLSEELREKLNIDSKDLNTSLFMERKINITVRKLEDEFKIVKLLTDLF